MRLSFPLFHGGAILSSLIACSFAISDEKLIRGSERLHSFTSDSPLGVVRQWQDAYEAQDLAAYGTVFTEDFRYHFCDSDLIARYPDGWGRVDELASAEHLFEGFTNAAGVRLPGAETIDIEIADRAVVSDPEHPDSASHYQVVELSGVRLLVRTEDGSIMTDVQPHVLYVVRGDAACLGPRQSASLDRWYIRKWIEGRAKAPSVAETEPQAPAAPAAPVQFGFHSIAPNPARSELTLRFSLPTSEPAHVLLINVAGRVQLREELDSATGDRAHVLRLSGRLIPGIYWVTLVQGDQRATKRVVITN